jgi:hypothetical protein
MQTSAVEGVGDKMVQPRGWSGRRRRRGRGDVGAGEKVGNETTTQFGCVLVSMIRVAPAGTLRRGGREKHGWERLKFG